MNILTIMGQICGRMIGSLDREFQDSYRNILFGQYRSLNNPVDDPKAKAEAESVINKEGEKKEITWEDLYRLELAIIKLEPVDLLRRRTWILRQEYKEVASAEEIKDYYASNPPDPEKHEDAPLLRADCIRLQEELSWRYIVVWVLEEFRSKLTRRVLLWTGVFLLFALAFASPAIIAQIGGLWLSVNLPFLVLIVVPGVIGGLVSTLRRIQTVRLDGNADLALTQLDQGNAGVILSPFLGGVFAFLLFCLFAGSFLTGSLLPKVGLENLWGAGSQELDFAEIAKLVIWSFIAGFSERFVPDRLEKLGQDIGQSSAPPNPRPNRNPAPAQ